MAISLRNSLCAVIGLSWCWQIDVSIMHEVDQYYETPVNGGIIFSHSKLVIPLCKYTVLYCIIVFSYFIKLIIVTFFITFVQFMSFFNCKSWPMLVAPCLMRNLLCLGLCIAHKMIYKLWPFWFTLTLVLANIKCLSYSYVVIELYVIPCLMRTLLCLGYFTIILNTRDLYNIFRSWKRKQPFT